MWKGWRYQHPTAITREGSHHPSRPHLPYYLAVHCQLVPASSHPIVTGTAGVKLSLASSRVYPSSQPPPCLSTLFDAAVTYSNHSSRAAAATLCLLHVTAATPPLRTLAQRHTQLFAILWYACQAARSQAPAAGSQVPPPLHGVSSSIRSVWNPAHRVRRLPFTCSSSSSISSCPCSPLTASLIHSHSHNINRDKLGSERQLPRRVPHLLIVLELSRRGCRFFSSGFPGVDPL